MTNELNFTKYLDPEATVAMPSHTVEDIRRIDELGMIGESKLKSSGFYVRMVGATPLGVPRKPEECTVLVVEDDAGTAQMIVKVLEKLGYRTRGARNRNEIAAGLSAKPMPALILMDVVMPDVNGFDVLNRIRQHSALREIPIVMLTSLSERKDIAKGLMLGADGYLTKPVLPSTLMDVVQAILAPDKASRSGLGTEPGGVA